MSATIRADVNDGQDARPGSKQSMESIPTAVVLSHMAERNTRKTQSRAMTLFGPYISKTKATTSGLLWTLKTVRSSIALGFYYLTRIFGSSIKSGIGFIVFVRIFILYSRDANIRKGERL